MDGSLSSLSKSKCTWNIFIIILFFEKKDAYCILVFRHPLKSKVLITMCRFPLDRYLNRPFLSSSWAMPCFLLGIFAFEEIASRSAHWSKVGPVKDSNPNPAPHAPGASSWLAGGCHLCGEGAGEGGPSPATWSKALPMLGTLGRNPVFWWPCSALIAVFSY